MLEKVCPPPYDELFIENQARKKINEVYTFPVHFNGSQYFEHLVVLLQMASIKSGFILKKNFNENQAQITTVYF